MQDISWKWVGIGTLIIVCLNFASSQLLAGPLMLPLARSLGLLGGLVVFALIIASLSFFVGGVIVGRLSPGVTVREPALASLAAIAINQLVSLIRSGDFNLLGLVIAAGLCFGMGWLGGKVGEAWQGRSRPRPAA